MLNHMCRLLQMVEESQIPFLHGQRSILMQKKQHIRYTEILLLEFRMFYYYKD